MSRSFECPNCGAEVKAGKKVCRECGSDDTTGWMSSEEIGYQSIDIPEGYGDQEQLGPDEGRAWVTVVAIILVVGLILLFVLR
jgi:hypothetical protein